MQDTQSESNNDSRRSDSWTFDRGGRGGRGKKRRQKKGKKYAYLICLACRNDCHFFDRFFLDRMGEELSMEDKARRNERAQRFKPGLEGNRKFKQKVSINEMIKTVVSAACCHYC